MKHLSWDSSLFFKFKSAAAYYASGMNKAIIPNDRSFFDHSLFAYYCAVPYYDILRGDISFRTDLTPISYLCRKALPNISLIHAQFIM